MLPFKPTVAVSFLLKIMPRSLMKHAVHPSYRISNPNTKYNKSAYVAIIGIIIISIFCYLLFSPNFISSL